MSADVLDARADRVAELGWLQVLHQHEAGELPDRYVASVRVRPGVDVDERLQAVLAHAPAPAGWRVRIDSTGCER